MSLKSIVALSLVELLILSITGLQCIANTYKYYISEQNKPPLKLIKSLRSGYFTTPKSLQYFYCVDLENLASAITSARSIHGICRQSGEHPHFFVVGNLYRHCSAYSVISVF